jgi:hypothetical protein
VITCAIVSRVMSIMIPSIATYAIVFKPLSYPCSGSYTLQRSNKIGRRMSLSIFSRSRSKKSLHSVTKETAAVQRWVRAQLSAISAMSPEGKLYFHG